MVSTDDEYFERERTKPGSSQETVNLNFLPNSSKGNYIFALSSTLTCEKNQVFKIGISGNIKRRFSSYNITEPWGLQLLGILTARKDLTQKDLRRLEKELFQYLISKPNISKLHTTTRVRKSGELIVGKWKDIQDGLWDFYEENEEFYAPFLDMETRQKHIGIVLFKRSKKKTKCGDVKTIQSTV